MPGSRGRRPRLWRRIGARPAGLVTAWLIRGLGATWRVRFEGPDPRSARGGTPQIAALWHRDLVTTAYLFRDRGYGVAVSRSQEGDLITEVLRRLGYADPARGSSSRGGTAALRGLVELVRDGVTVSVQVDGPRGPARRSKPGVLALARLTGVPITPAAISARPCRRAASWDGTLLPLPFARVVCRFGEPLEIPAELPPDAEAPLGAELDRRMNGLTDALDAELGFRDPNSPS